MRLGSGEHDGVTLCRELRSREDAPHCLVLTAFEDDDAMVGAIMAGAAGYLLKQVRGQDVVHAVREVAAGRSLLDPPTTAQLLRTLREADDDVSATHTERERHRLDPI